MAGGKKPTGRNSFTQDFADRICERLAEGRSLRSICSDDDMPSVSSVCKWLGQFPSFAEQYARAREAQADAIFDEILHIADTPQLGEIVTTKPIMVDGKPVAGAEVREVKHEDMLGHRRLQIDARKWMAGKLQPKKYGDKLELDHKGELGPITINLVRQPEAPDAG